MITLLLTIALVGSNMDVILKQGIVYQVRAEITENPAIAESFSTVEEFDKFIQDQIDQRLRHLDLMSHGIRHKELGLLCIKY